MMLSKTNDYHRLASKAMFYDENTTIIATASLHVVIKPLFNVLNISIPVSGPITHFNTTLLTTTLSEYLTTWHIIYLSQFQSDILKW